MEVRIAPANAAPSIAPRTALLDGDTLAALDVTEGAAIAVDGTDRTVLMARQWDDGPTRTVALAGIDRRNAGVTPGETAAVETIETRRAERVSVRPSQQMTVTGGTEAVERVLTGRPVSAGDRTSVSLFGDSLTVQYVTESTRPSGPVVVDEETTVRVAESQSEPVTQISVTRDELGGVDEIFETLSRLLTRPLERSSPGEGVGTALDGVLLVGPPGVGKTSLAYALGEETEARFLSVLPRGRYHEDSLDVRAVREDALDGTPTLVFFDDLHVLAPTDSDDGTAAALGRLIDELTAADRVAVLAATSDPDAVAPAARRGGRLSHELPVPTPDTDARREILAVHLADVPLADVSLSTIATRTPGFVGADLAALASESVRHAIDRRETGSLDEIAVRQSDIDAALSSITPSGLREFSVDRPEISYDDVGGLTEVKRDLVRTVEWPLLYPDLYEEVHSDPPAGLLLYGPPGTGKTMLAKAVATSSDANFIGISGPELFDRYVGESERAVREVFERARQSAPTVVFFDEVDALAARRDAADSTGVTDRVVSQLLTELDGLEPSAGVVVIGATNRPDLVDRALLRPGRFERLLEVPLPDDAAREEIFAVHLEEIPVGPDVDAEELAALTEGYSGSDIAAVVREAGLLAMEETLSAHSFEPAAAADDLRVSREHLRRAIESVDRSVTEEMRETYDSYAEGLRE